MRTISKSLKTNGNGKTLGAFQPVVWPRLPHYLFPKDVAPDGAFIFFGIEFYRYAAPTALRQMRTGSRRDAKARRSFKSSFNGWVGVFCAPRLFFS
jgi:hypothetical protein